MPHNGNLAHFLDLRLDFGKEVDELDVSGQEELSGVETAQVELGVQQLELHDRTKWEKRSNKVKLRIYIIMRILGQ